MIVSATVHFTLRNLSWKARVDELLYNFGIVEVPVLGDKDVAFGYLDYSIKFPYNPKVIEHLVQSLQQYPENVVKNAFFSCDFSYSHSEIEASPLFFIQSIGNIASKYPQNKSNRKRIPFCSTCRRYYLEKGAPIKINTAILQKYDIVYSDGAIIISERLASLLETWNATGYQLTLVEHIGSSNKRVPAYEVVPINVLPPQIIPDYLREDINFQTSKCPDCNLGGYPKYPFHYDVSIRDSIQDFNLTYEWGYAPGPGTRISKKMLISKRLKQLFQENWLFKNEFFGQWIEGDYVGTNDWIFTPVILVK